MQNTRWSTRFDKHGKVELRRIKNPHGVFFSDNSEKRIAFALWETSQATPEEALTESERNILHYVKRTRESLGKKGSQPGLAASALMLLGIREAREKGHL